MTQEMKNLIDKKVEKYAKGMTFLSPMRKNLKVANDVMQLELKYRHNETLEYLITKMKELVGITE